ncbi:sulfatase-like hydrolase/transferase [Maioricimonas sp. JC845]|uniref:sulfatase-like hydrolase/transferase n=1 Tax=Maioricimonas sp. JC845 TaxID=3232138 RepID=UPI00345766D3
MKTICLALLTALLAITPATAESTRPNIVFIMVDDLGKDWIGCYGADEIETPRIDALAADGMLFHNAYSMPQCTPTRVTLLTGRYPHHTGWVNHWDVPRWGVGYFDWEREQTYARLLRDAGYRTAIAGKWQINDFRLVPDALNRHGFDDWCVWTGYESGNRPSAERYWNPYIHTRDGSRTYEGEFGPDIYNRFLIEFMERHRDEPMMLYYPMCLTHGPLVTTPDEPNVTTGREKHRAMVRYTDKLVGRLVDGIERLGLRDRTIIIFTTDNGTSGGMRGTIDGKRPSGGKASKYEGGVCMPFIVNCPGLVPAGVETDALVDFSDLLPTFVELAGRNVPDRLDIDGHSFAPLLLGKAEDSPREWIAALGHGPARRDAQGVRGVEDFASRVIRDKRFKVWIDPDRQISALYDLQSDPLEQRNLIDAPPAEAEASLAKFREVLAGMPEQDARPQYRDRAANPWDRPVSEVKPRRKRQQSGTK